MTCLQMQDLCSHSLCSIHLLLRLYCLIVVSDDEPTGLRMPSCRSDWSCENRTLGCALRCENVVLLSGSEILGEVVIDSFLSEEEISILNWVQLGKCLGWGIAAGQSTKGFSLLGCKCCDIHETSDLWVVSRFCNHGSAVRVPAQ